MREQHEQRPNDAAQPIKLRTSSLSLRLLSVSWLLVVLEGQARSRHDHHHHPTHQSSVLISSGRSIVLLNAWHDTKSINRPSIRRSIE